MFCEKITSLYFNLNSNKENLCLHVLLFYCEAKARLALIQSMNPATPLYIDKCTSKFIIE